MYQDYTTPDTVNVGSFANPKTSGVQENQNQVKRQQSINNVDVFVTFPGRIIKYYLYKETIL